MKHYKLLLSYLENAIREAEQQKQTDATAAIHQIADSIHKRSLVVIFSDMFDQIENPEPLFSALGHLRHNKHEVMLFHVFDKTREMDFTFENKPYLFIDVETGERIKMHPDEVKDTFSRKLKAYRHDLELKCLQHKIDYVEADINEDFKRVLQAYLVKRNKMN